MDTDETNHHEDPGIEAWIDPAWEARIVALLQGEASDFEREDLERQMRENPELRVFHRRMLAVHGLLAEAFGTGAGTAGAAPLRLSPERRAAVLERILENTAPEASTEAKGPKPMNLVEIECPKAAAVRRRKAWILAITSAAAVFVSMFVIAGLFLRGCGTKNISTMSVREEDIHPSGAETNDFAIREKGEKRDYGYTATDGSARLEKKAYAQSMKQKPASPAPVTGPTTSLESTVSSGSIALYADEATPLADAPALRGSTFGDGFGAAGAAGGFGGGGAQVAGKSESHLGNEVARFAIPDAPSEEVKERWFAEMDGKAGAKPDVADSPAPPEMLFGRPESNRPEIAQVADGEGRERLSAFYKQNQAGQAPSEGKPGGTTAAEATDGRALAAVDAKGLAQEERFRWASQPGAITTTRGSSPGSAGDPVSEDSYSLDLAEQPLARVEAKADDWSDRNAPLVAPGGELARGGDLAEEDRTSALASDIAPGEPGARPAGGAGGAGAPDSAAPEGGIATKMLTTGGTGEGIPEAATPEDSIAKAETAKEMDSEGRSDDGIRTLDESVVGEPVSELGEAGRGLVRTGISGEPELLAKQEVAATVQESEPLKDLGKDYFALGDFDNAEMRYKQALGVDGTDAEARKGLEEIEQARTAYRNGARDHTRAKSLREGVDSLWESEVPALAPDDQVSAKVTGLTISGLTYAENAPATSAPESTVAEVMAGKKFATADFGLATAEQLSLGEVAASNETLGGVHRFDVPAQKAAIDGLMDADDEQAAAPPESGVVVAEAMKQQQGQEGEYAIDLNVSPETVEFEGFMNRGLSVAEGQAPGGSDKADASGAAASPSPASNPGAAPAEADGLAALQTASTASATVAEPADPGVVTRSLSPKEERLATGLDRSEGDESAPAKDAAHWAFKAPEVGAGVPGGGSVDARIKTKEDTAEASRLFRSGGTASNGISEASGDMLRWGGQRNDVDRSKVATESGDGQKENVDLFKTETRYAEEAATLTAITEGLARERWSEPAGEKAMEFDPPEIPQEFGSYLNGEKLAFSVTPSNPTSFETVNEVASVSNFARGFLDGEALGVPGETNGRASGQWDRSLASVDKKLAEVTKSEVDKPVDAVLEDIPATDPAKPAEPAAESAPAPEPTPIAEPAPPVEAQPEIETAVEPVSTFSLHVSDVSFKLAEAALLEKGEWPEAGKVRIEEFVNAFDYGDPAPAPDEAVACRTEQAAHPFLPQRNLLRVAMRTGATGRASSQPLRLTVLLDKSGSMERADREASVQRAMEALASHLTANDSVTLIGFARQPRLIADRLPGERANELAGLVERAPSEGGTNLEEALRLAGDKAREQFVEGGQNRIVLVTDGAANLGNARPESLGEMVVGLRQQGIAFDACGVGADGLNDAILEALTRQGDGRYYFLNRPADADESFVRQLAGALRPAAKNVKVQVIFNPERVKSYRLLGFEKHLLKKEDFRNDAVDAAEMAAAEAGVGLYEMEVNPGGQGAVGEVFVRFQDMATGAMVERSWTIPFDAGAAALDEATPSMQLAGTAAYLGMKLRGGPDAGLVRFDGFGKVTSGLRAHYAESPRVRRLLEMVEKVRGGE